MIKVESYKIEKDLLDKKNTMVDNSEYGTWEICSSINDAAFKSDAIVY